MKKSSINKHSNGPIQVMTCVNAARHYGKLFMNAKVKGYSQWFAGTQNNVTDASSQDWHRDDDKLTFI
jgi:hypothetical protein